MPSRVEVTMFNQSEIAEMLGVERETVSRWKAQQSENMFPVHHDSGGDGSGDRLYFPAVAQWYLRHELIKQLKGRR